MTDLILDCYTNHFFFVLWNPVLHIYMLEELFPSYDQCGRQAVQMMYLSLPFSSKITDSKHWKSSRITSIFTREH